MALVDVGDGKDPYLPEDKLVLKAQSKRYVDSWVRTKGNPIRGLFSHRSRGGVCFVVLGKMRFWLFLDALGGFVDTF